VLMVYNKGDYGTIELNKKLQRIANLKCKPGSGVKFGNFEYYEGDVVMQCANDYKAQIYNSKETAFLANGETGVVKHVMKNGIVCSFDGIDILYTKDKMVGLSLAYSYNVFKAQGSTIKYVIYIMPRAHVYLTNANLMYTGVTRASDKCFHIGMPSTLNMAMKKKENFSRRTFTKDLLCGLYGDGS